MELYYNPIKELNYVNVLKELIGSDIFRDI